LTNTRAIISFLAPHFFWRLYSPGILGLHLLFHSRLQSTWIPNHVHHSNSHLNVYTCAFYSFSTCQLSYEPTPQPSNCTKSDLQRCVPIQKQCRRTMVMYVYIENGFGVELGNRRMVKIVQRSSSRLPPVKFLQIYSIPTSKSVTMS